MDGYRLGIDFGTSNTVAVLAWPDGRAKPLLFDGSPVLPSAVFAQSSEELLTGRDALHAARAVPGNFEPHPKRRIDDGLVLLGRLELPVTEVIAAVLRRAATEAHRVAGDTLSAVVLTHPATWGRGRREQLVAGARAAGLSPVGLVAEPVAAAAYLVEVAHARLPVGGHAVVYDFGAGTFDATVVRRTDGGFDVLATRGLDDAGGLDIDAAVIAYLGTVYGPRHGDRWQRLTGPVTPGDRRSARQLWDDVRTAKETLSRISATLIHLPLLDHDAPLGREQLETIARPVVERTIAATRVAVRNAGLQPADLAGVFLVGGASRLPLAATMLHRALGLAAFVTEQPELVVAEGSLNARPDPVSEPVRTEPRPSRRAPRRRPATAAPPPTRPRPSDPPPTRPGVTPSTGATTDAATSAAGSLSDPPPAPIARTAEPRQQSPAARAAVDRAAATVPPRTDRTATSRPSGTGSVGPPRDAGTAATDKDSFEPALRQRRRIMTLVLVVLMAGVGTVFAIAATREDPTEPDARPTASVPAQSPDPLEVAFAPIGTMAGTSAGGTRIAFSPDGTVLAGGADRAVRLWDTTSRQPVGGPMLGLESTVDFVAFGDGRLVTTDRNRIIRVWDVTSGHQYLATYTVDEVLGLAVSPDRRMAAVARRDGTTRFYPVATLYAAGNPLRPSPDTVATSLCYAPDGKTMAFGLADGRVVLWNLATNRLVATLNGHSAGVSRVVFSPNGATLASADQNREVRLWDVAGGRTAHSFPTYGSEPHDLAFAPDGRVLAVAAAGQPVRLWQVNTGRELATLPSETTGAYTVAFRPDRAVLAVGTVTGVSLWSVTATPRRSG